MNASEEQAPAVLRHPVPEDGRHIWGLVERSGVLDLNSAYLYILLCKDFADTCLVAETRQALVGFITGYRPPRRPDRLFVWQIGVDASQRGQGLGGRLLRGVLGADSCRGVGWVETTVSPSNEASRALFGSLARRLGAELEEEPCFGEELFPGEGHESEPMLRVGPFDEDRRLRLAEADR